MRDMNQKARTSIKLLTRYSLLLVWLSVIIMPSLVTQSAPPDDFAINFQDPNTTTPAGYFRDFGEPFGLRTGASQGSGQSYGWVVPGSNTALDISQGGSWPGNGRRRFVTADMRYDTLMQMQYTGGNGTAAEAAWEYELPNDDYLVKVVAGDAQYTDTAYHNNTVHVVNVEGVNVIAPFTPTDTVRSQVASQVVTVSDGRLTIDAVGGTNTRILFIEVQRMTTSQPYITGHESF